MQVTQANRFPSSSFVLAQDDFVSTMINTALSSPCSGPNSRFVSIHNGARPRHLARARLGHLARREVSVQVRARRLREHEVVRGVAGGCAPCGPDHLRYVEPVCAFVGTMPALQQPSRKTHWSRHTRCSVSSLWLFPPSQVGRWPRQRPAAHKSTLSSTMTTKSPSCLSTSRRYLPK